MINCVECHASNDAKIAEIFGDEPVVFETLTTTSNPPGDLKMEKVKCPRCDTVFWHIDPKEIAELLSPFFSAMTSGDDDYLQND